MRLKNSLLMLALVCALSHAFGQVVDLSKDRVPLAELKSSFRFHAGDDPRWADPAFEDSSWSLLKPDQSWYTQGYKNYSGVGWYRFRVTVPQGQNDLALLIPRVSSSYAVYANGLLVGQIGSLPPHPRAVFAPNEIFFIPRSIVDPGEPLVIAVRVWYWPLLSTYFGGGFNATPVLGDAAAISRLHDLQVHDSFWNGAMSLVMFAANSLSALLGLALFALRRSEREYLWFGAAQVFWTVSSIAGIAPAFLRTPYVWGILIYALGNSGGVLLNLVFFHALLHERRRLLFWIGALPMLLPFPALCFSLAGWTHLSLFNQVQSFAFLPYTVAVALLLIRSARKGNSEAWLLVFPFTLSCICWIYYGSLRFLNLSEHPTLAALRNHLNHIISWPFVVNIGDFTGLMCIASVCAVLVLRFARSRRDEERLAAELEAARVVQHVLIPDEVPFIPGYQIESVYKPAGQVGGDFFQIIPRLEGGALIAIGDVSGKGMPAAMTVSLLVGTFRTLAHYTQFPGEILRAMNQRMLGRSKGAFTTCLVIRVEPNGTLTAANAGHILPYVDGREIPAETGLPLGLSADSIYPEMTIQLPPGSQLALVTDGIVEARNPNGELFGFDRTAALSNQPAEEIAAAAQSFGQEDDITVLTLCMASDGVAA